MKDIAPKWFLMACQVLLVITGYFLGKSDWLGSILTGLVCTVVYSFWYDETHPGSTSKQPAELRAFVRNFLSNGPKHSRQIMGEIQVARPEWLRPEYEPLYRMLNYMEEAGEIVSFTQDDEGRLHRYWRLVR